MNLRDLSDEELDALQNEVVLEQERRLDLRNIPEQISSLTKKFLDGGGDPEDLL